jgi:hypothetical protein
MMRQCHTITQEANKPKSYVEILSNSALSRFVQSFWPKNCHNSVMVSRVAEPEPAGAETFGRLPAPGETKSKRLFRQHGTKFTLLTFQNS